MRRTRFLAILASTALALLFPATHARAQAAPAQFFWVCYSAGNEVNVYVSGVLQGPATAAAAFRVGFVQVLTQRYSYQGNAACVLARTAINAQDDMNRRVAALRSAKKNVVQTGWTEAAPAATSGAAPGASGTSGAIASQLGGLVGGTSTPAATAVATASAAQPAKAQTQSAGNAAGGNTAQGAGSTGGSTTASVLATLFGTSPAPAAGGSGAGGAGASAASGANTAAQGQGGGKTTGATTANGSPAVQVASTLSTLFGSKGSSGAAPGGAGNAARPATPVANGVGGAPGGAPPANANAPGSGLPQGALGSAQFSNTMLVVYGCGRQGTSGTQVLCVADLTNQNQKDTLVQSDAVWKDAFIVDDRGDRHTRTNGYFLNIDGEQRQQLDIDYGKSAKFILAFDGIPAKVEKIELRSATGGLNVNGISLIAVGGADASGQAQPAAH